eukprot:NODE_6883_length_340_cov_95.065292_g6153_i0.p1 GENE.NODE_6883_length_340_cov_95.065292_g6153_i0~~NODE_6883_length_340_cov_95.065292_g6153_i0.p1  ORF type:complete len:65 (-),score=2.62 NODE_6883_length_340_cov_95.065292_g6153_i0:45-239(-)
MHVEDNWHTPRMSDQFFRSVMGAHSLQPNGLYSHPRVTVLTMAWNMLTVHLACSIDRTAIVPRM